jgi:hypothetical protein
MPDYLPGPDPEFNVWQENFLIYATANMATLGLVAGDLTPITTGQTNWSSAYSDHVAKQAAATAARTTKDTRRAEYEAAIRPLVRRLQASSSVDDAERAGLGITVPDPTATPAAVPTTKPVGQVDTRQRLQHTISWVDELTPTSKGKPAGVQGAEVWVKVQPTADAPPGDPSGFTFLALDSRSPYLATYDGADGGKTAHYLLRWVNTRGQKGPWSETVSATIGA